MMKALKTAIAAAAVALSGFLFSGGVAPAAVVHISNGAMINPINPGDLYVFELTENVTEGAGSFSFTFVANSADAPLPVLAVSGNVRSAQGATLTGAYLSWFDGANTVSTPLTNIGLFAFGELSTLFTDPNALTQVLTLGWTSRSGNIQFSVNVAAVPLPAGGLLLIGALGGLAFLRRRKAA